MKLKEYLHSTMKDGETYAARYSRFGSAIGVSLHAVYKWVNGQRRINDPLKLRIEKHTGGMVTVDDLVRSK